MDYKYCKNCGTANKAGNRFCEACGAMIDGGGMENTGYAYGAPVQGAGGPAVVHKQSGPNLKVIIPVVIGVLLLVGGGVFAAMHFLSQDKEIDLLGDVDEKVLVTFGVDGEGSIDKVDKEEIKKRQGYSNMDEDVREFLDSVEYECDKEGSTNLSNSDAATITATFDPEKAEDCGVKVIGGDSGKVEKDISLSGCFDEKNETAGSDSSNGSYESGYSSNSSNNNSHDDYDDDSGDSEISEYERGLDDNAYDRVSDDYLTENEISDFNKDKTQRWINYICAKNGYRFHKDKDEMKYFEGLDWYNKIKGNITDSDEAASYGTDIEKFNYDILVKRIKKFRKK